MRRGERGLSARAAIERSRVKRMPVRDGKTRRNKRLSERFHVSIKVEKR
jgi:hypothetical protein